MESTLTRYPTGSSRGETTCGKRIAASWLHQDRGQERLRTENGVRNLRRRTLIQRKHENVLNRRDETKTSFVYTSLYPPLSTRTSSNMSSSPPAIPLYSLVVPANPADRCLDGKTAVLYALQGKTGALLAVTRDGKNFSMDMRAATYDLRVSVGTSEQQRMIERVKELVAARTTAQRTATSPLAKPIQRPSGGVQPTATLPPFPGVKPIDGESFPQPRLDYAAGTAVAKAADSIPGFVPLDEGKQEPTSAKGSGAFHKMMSGKAYYSRSPIRDAMVLPKDIGYHVTAEMPPALTEQPTPPDEITGDAYSETAKRIPGLVFSPRPKRTDPPKSIPGLMLAAPLRHAYGVETAMPGLIAPPAVEPGPVPELVYPNLDENAEVGSSRTPEVVDLRGMPGLMTPLERGAETKHRHFTEDIAAEKGSVLAEAAATEKGGVHAESVASEEASVPESAALQAQTADLSTMQEYRYDVPPVPFGGSILIDQEPLAEPLDNATVYDGVEGL